MSVCKKFTQWQTRKKNGNKGNETEEMTSENQRRGVHR